MAQFGVRPIGGWLLPLILEVIPMTTLFLHGPVVPDASRDSTEAGRRTPLKQAIKEFLTGASSRSGEPEVCSRCGRPMQHLNATFAFYGSNKQWNIPLPVCPCSLS